MRLKHIILEKIEENSFKAFWDLLNNENLSPEAKDRLKSIKARLQSTFYAPKYLNEKILRIWQKKYLQNAKSKLFNIVEKIVSDGISDQVLIDFLKNNKKYKSTNSDYPTDDFFHKLVHFRGIKYPKLQNFIPPETMIDSDFLKELEELEQEYLENFETDKRYISYDEQPLEEDGGELKVIWNSGDKYWVSLNVASCSLEAKAMGHCGNSGGGENDLVFSFRTLIKNDDTEWYWKPHLTFTYNDGVLIERKGFANSKPKKEYYPYIVELLINKHFPIEDFNNEGYKPENDFKLEDLSSEQILKLHDLNRWLILNYMSDSDIKNKEKFQPLIIKELENAKKNKIIQDYHIVKDSAYLFISPSEKDQEIINNQIMDKTKVVDNLLTVFFDLKFKDRVDNILFKNVPEEIVSKYKKDFKELFRKFLNDYYDEVLEEIKRKNYDKFSFDADFNYAIPVPKNVFIVKKYMNDIPLWVMDSKKIENKTSDILKSISVLDYIFSMIYNNNIPSYHEGWKKLKDFWNNIANKNVVTEAWQRLSNKTNIEPKNKNIKLELGVTDSYKGQLDGYVIAHDISTSHDSYHPIFKEMYHKVVGKIYWSKFEDEVKIKLITVDKNYQRQNIGLAMLSKLQREFPELEIDFGMVTDSGKSLME